MNINQFFKHSIVNRCYQEYYKMFSRHVGPEIDLYSILILGYSCSKLGTEQNRYTLGWPDLS